MKPLEHNGVQYTNSDAWRTAKATKAPQQAETADMGGGKPTMTHHHPDGKHTTIHDDGSEHNHENLEALKAHLDTFLSEEASEGDDWDKDETTEAA